MSQSLLSLEADPWLVHAHEEPSKDPGAFYRSVALAPSGTMCLSTTEDNRVAVFQLASHVLEAAAFTAPVDAPLGSESQALVEQLQFSPGESIYDACWYPHVHAHDPQTHCFVTSCRDHPIQLWDANTGALRASYRGYDHLDELNAANSVTFNLVGDKIYAGYNRMIRVFDTNEPGRAHQDIPTTPSRKSPYGQKGIISCLSFNPDYSGAYAAGSFAESIGVYVEGQTECVLELRNLGFGLTSLKWSRCGNYLFAGGRKFPDIICWDIRHTRSEVGRCSRVCTSNQRIGFDLDPWGEILVTGSQDGSIRFYSTQTFELVKDIHSQHDTVNGVALHPYAALLFASTGQRHFMEDKEEEDEEEEEDGDERPPHDKPSRKSCIRCYAIRRRARLEYEATAAETDAHVS